MSVSKSIRSWRYGTRALFAGVTICAFIAAGVGAARRAYFAEKVQAAPNIEQLTSAELNALTPDQKHLYDEMTKGHILGVPAARYMNILQRASSVQPYFGRKIYWFLSAKSAEGNIGVFIIVGRNGIIIRCGVCHVLS